MKASAVSDKSRYSSMSRYKSFDTLPPSGWVNRPRAAAR